MRRIVPNSLTGRLAVSVVILVAAVCVAISALTTAALWSNLNQQLDQKVAAAHQRDIRGAELGMLPAEPPANAPDLARIAGQDAGTLTAFLTATGDRGRVISDDGEFRAVSGTVIKILEQAPVGDAADRDLSSLGEYRVQVSRVGDITVVTGYPTADLTSTVATLLGWEALFSVLCVAAAAGVAVVVVRRQLRPLREVAQTAHEVAELPLASGEVGVTARVPSHLTDVRTEVGQVAVALNTLLGHMEASLDARHRNEQQVRQFVADASHELRTPLATIQGYAELGLRDQDGLEPAMTKVQGETQRMTALVEDLLLLARLDAGRPLAKEPVDLSRLAMETVEDARILAPNHQWRLDLPEEAVTVTGDEHRLHQVLTNLTTNARRHAPAGTIVTVGVEASDTGALVTVRDDGPGISDDLQATLFERFTRGDSSRTRDSGGAGLGLSLARAIVAAHGGSLRVASRPGDTRFTLALPN